MPRIIAAPLIVLLTLAACTTQAAPSESPTAQPTPVSKPTSSPTNPVDPTQPAEPSWTGHPAAGLALVRIIADGQPTEIFVVEADGTLRQLTGLAGGTGGSFPVWSPDGGRMAFTGPKLGETTVRGMVAVMNADGTDERQIAEGQHPRWSPDGALIAFQEVDDVTGTDHSFYLVDPEAGDITDLGLGYEPRWIGNDRLAYGANSYAADGLATSHLMIMTLATGESQLVGDWTRGFPSPDGSMLLLEHEGVVSLAGTGGSVPLAEGGDPVWAPDGSRFAVLVGHDTEGRPVWDVVDLEGRVLQSGILGSYPTWSPDGTRLALEVYRPDQPVIQVVDLASGEIVWEEQGQQPAWRPAPSS